MEKLRIKYNSLFNQLQCTEHFLWVVPQSERVKGYSRSKGCMCEVQNHERCGAWGDRSEGVWIIGAEGGRSGLAGVLLERPGRWGLGFTLHTQPGPARNFSRNMRQADRRGAFAEEVLGEEPGRADVRLTDTQRPWGRASEDKALSMQGLWCRETSKRW